MISESMAGRCGYIVLAFFAAQFVAYVQGANLCLLIALSGAKVLKASGPGPLLLGMVPLMMSLGFIPEPAQAAFRIGGVHHQHRHPAAALSRP